MMHHDAVEAFQNTKVSVTGALGMMMHHDAVDAFQSSKVSVTGVR